MPASPSAQPRMRRAESAASAACAPLPSAAAAAEVSGVWLRLSLSTVPGGAACKAAARHLTCSLERLFREPSRLRRSASSAIGSERSAARSTASGEEAAPPPPGSSRLRS